MRLHDLRQLVDCSNMLSTGLLQVVSQVETSVQMTNFNRLKLTSLLTSCNKPAKLTICIKSAAFLPCKARFPLGEFVRATRSENKNSAT